jgi:hypothetical protein
MVGGMIVEITGTKHVATAGFDVAGGHIKIGFGRFLLRRRREVDEASGERKERKQKYAGRTRHFFLQGNWVVKGPTEFTESLRLDSGRGKILSDPTDKEPSFAPRPSLSWAGFENQMLERQEGV